VMYVCLYVCVFSTSSISLWLWNVKGFVFIISNVLRHTQG
jgi:hypothetical protein